MQLVPVKGFAPIPAGDESETTTSLAIGTYATYLSDDDDDPKSSSGLHSVPDIPIEVVEVGYDPQRVARPDPRREQPTLVADEVETERQPKIESAIVARSKHKPEALRSAAESEPDTVTQTETGTETQRRPPVNLAEVYGALETVPLAHAVVKFAIESVDARAAARAAGRPVPSPPPPPMAPGMPPPVYPMAHPQAPLYMPAPLPPVNVHPEPEPPPRGLAVELAIGVCTFVAVAAPAFWYFFVR